jgi:hypothetical protein
LQYVFVECPRIYLTKLAARLGYKNPPSLIIPEPVGVYTLDEWRARHRLIMQQRADLERASGSHCVVAQIAVHLDILDWGKWQAAREREAEAEASIDHEHDQKEARLRAKLHPLPRRSRRIPNLRLVNRRGHREPREVLLTEDDLYLDDAHPPFITFLPRLHFICNICHNIKSHPVRYALFPRDFCLPLILIFARYRTCGHSNCYVCIRVSLETSWECPTCEERISARPTAYVKEEANIAAEYPDWDQSRVEYRWDGLVFPTTQLP